MSLQLETVGLSKTFAHCTALDRVSFRFAPGRIHAVLGENGAGKSTLMKVLFGLYPPTSGEIRVGGEKFEWRSAREAISRGLGMVQQHFTLLENSTVIDNILVGAEVCSALGVLRRSEAIAQLEELLPMRHLSVPWDALVRDLSIGQKQRVEILKLLFRQAQVLFLDEPTAVLTPIEIEEFFVLLRKLRDSGRTIILITHKIGEVLAVCDTYSVLRQGRSIVQGEVKGAVAAEIVEAMIGRTMPDFAVARPAVHGQAALVTRELRVGDAHAEPGLSLHVQRGEIVGIAGVEGSGQSELVDALMGLREFHGSARLFDEELQNTSQVRGLGVALVPEDRLAQALWLEESCYTNMIIGLESAFLKHNIFKRAAIEGTTAAWAKEFDVRAGDLLAPVASLSGGNQQKLVFAREVGGRAPRFVICHQPTRGVDLGAIDLLHRKLVELRNQGLGVLLLSSELDELLKLCDRIYVFYDGQVSGEFTRAQFNRAQIGAAMTGVAHA